MPSSCFTAGCSQYPSDFLRTVDQTSAKDTGNLVTDTVVFVVQPPLHRGLYRFNACDDGSAWIQNLSTDKHQSLPGSIPTTCMETGVS